MGSRQYNTNAPYWLDGTDGLEAIWPTFSKYLYKFSRLAAAFPTAADVRKLLTSRPLTLAHGDLHFANLEMDRRDGSVVVYDWAEINLVSGPEEVANFVLRSRIWAPRGGQQGEAGGGGGAARLCVKKEVIKPILQQYYWSLTRHGVSKASYPFEQLQEHVCLGMLGSAATLVKHMEELKAQHPIGPTPFGCPRWLLEKLKEVLSLTSTLCL